MHQPHMNNARASPSFQVEQSPFGHNSQGGTPFLPVVGSLEARVLHAAPGGAWPTGSPGAAGLSPPVGLGPPGASFSVPGSFSHHPGVTPSYTPPVVMAAARPAPVLRGAPARNANPHGHMTLGPCDLAAEDECLSEECGEEPTLDPEHSFCGWDVRPALPVLLAVSTVLGAVQEIVVAFPLMPHLMSTFLATMVKSFMLIMYTVTTVCMVYAAFCDPGQLKPATVGGPLLADAEEAEGVLDKRESDELPARAHKTWQYEYPIRRYDHYCKWLANCIGLLNHREFVIMCLGLCLIGCCGALLDAFLIVRLQVGTIPDMGISTKVCIVMHLAYSACLSLRVGPIFMLHVGFISRNELANEWKKNSNYVLPSRETGELVSVNDLSDDEFNEGFEKFIYDKKRNQWDKDLITNWSKFWFTPRWPANQLGDF